MNKLTKYLLKKEWFLKSRDKHFKTQKFTLFTFFKYLFDTHFQKQRVAWFLFRFQKYKFYRNYLEPKIYKSFEVYREEWRP
jgi:hypothetical protein